MNLTNLKRWIVASAIKEFSKYAGGEKLAPEGSDKLTTKLNSFFEFRCDGPYNKPLASGCFKTYIEINILATCKRTVENFYKKDNMQGIAAEMLNRDFCVYKTGNQGTNAEDDGSYIGVMQLIPNDAIKTSDFGQIDPNAEVYQSVSEAHYEMYIGEP